MWISFVLEEELVMVEMCNNEMIEINGGVPWGALALVFVLAAGTLAGCPNNCDK